MNKMLEKFIKELEPEAKFVTTWNGYDAYIIPIEDADGEFVGLPEFILAKEDDIHFATVDERDSVLTKMPSSKKIKKFNPYHDELGRFTTADGATFFTIATRNGENQHLIDRAKQKEQKRMMAKLDEEFDKLLQERREARQAGDKDKLREIGDKIDAMYDKILAVGRALPIDPETIGGVKRRKPMEREQANGGHVNPDFEKVPGCETNCQSCVVAYEARLRGYNVKARPNYNNEFAKNLSLSPNKAWIDPKTGYHPTIKFNDPLTVATPSDARKWIEDTVKPGQRYTFEHLWWGEGTVGHIISVDRDKSDNLRLYDPQSGKTYQGDEVSGYLNRIQVVYTNPYGAEYGCAGLTRVDNMAINPQYADGIMEGYKK